MGQESRSKTVRRQVRLVEEQVRMPLVEALINARADMMEVVVTAGLKVVEAMLEEDRIRLCGAKHARVPGREITRGGTVRGELVLGGRRVAIRRPRARRLDGGEVRLPAYEAFGREDPLEQRAVEQMLIGVATRKYGRSLDPLPDSVATRGTSKSAVSRRFVARTRAELEAWARRPLGDLDLVALMIDGIGFGDYLLVVALGIDSTGKKHALAIREGSTENASLCRSMLSDVVARGVPADRAILVVIDGGTGARSAVRQVFGEYGIVQRCQVHYLEHVVIQCPKRRCWFTDGNRDRRLRITAAYSDARKPMTPGAGRQRRSPRVASPARCQNACKTSRFISTFVAMYRPVVATLACPR